MGCALSKDEKASVAPSLSLIEKKAEQTARPRSTTELEPQQAAEPLELVPEASPFWREFPRRTYKTRVYNAASASYEEHPEALSITISSNGIIADRYQVPRSVTHYGRDQIYWRYEHPTNFSYGCLHFHANKQYFHGMYAQGFNSTMASLHAIQGVAIPLQYTTRISCEPCYDESMRRCSGSCVTAGEYIDGSDVTIGYDWDSSGMPVQVFKISSFDLSDKILMDSPRHYIIEENEENKSMAKYEMCFPISADFVMADNSESFAGSIATIFVYGADMVQNQCLKGYVVTASGDEGSAYLSPSKKPVFSHPECSTSEETMPLSVLDLFSLCHAPPQVQENAKTMLASAIQDVVSKTHPDWVKNFFEPTKLMLTPALKKILQLPGANAFYSHLAIPYIGIQLCQKEDSGLVYTPVAQTRKLFYYFQHSLAKDPCYITQANALYLQAFLDNTPRLKDYLDDQERRKRSGNEEYYWAKELHNVILSHCSINTFVSTLFHNNGDGYHQLRDYGTLLSLLQPSGELALDVYKKLFTAVFLTLAEQMDCEEILDKIDLWALNFLQKFIARHDGDKPPQTNASAYKVWQTAQALRTAAETSGGVNKVAERIADLMAVQSYNIYRHSNEVGNKVVEWCGNGDAQHDRNLKRGVVVTVILVGWMTALQAFFRQKTFMDMQEKDASSVWVDFGIELLKNLPDVVSDSGTIQSATRQCVYTCSTLDTLNCLFDKMAESGRWIEEVAQTLQEFLPEETSQGTKFVVRPGNSLDGLFKSLSQILRIIAPFGSLIVAMAKTVVFIRERDPIVQDELITSVEALAKMFERQSVAANLSVEDLQTSAGPFAVFGLVLGILHSVSLSPRPSPSHIFYCNTLRNYIDGLSIPPADFSPRQK